MLVLGHVGITYGVALAAESLRPHIRVIPAGWPGGLWTRLQNSAVSLARRIDLRILLVGSILPDLIDKPVGLLLFPGVFGTGRLFCHSLIFPAALAIAGAWLYRVRRSPHLLVLAYGASMHLILDAMWRTPSVLFWPFAGPLPHGTAAEDWLARTLAGLLTNPETFLPELAGAILLVPFLCAVLRGAGWGRFMRSGDVS